MKKKYYFSKLLIPTFFCLLAIEFIFKGISFDFFDISLVRIILFTFSSSLILSYIASFFKPLVAKIMISVFNFIIAIYSLIQLAFKEFMGNFMSFGMLQDGDVNRISGEVSTFIRSIELKNFLLFIPVILMILWFIFGKKFISYERINWKKKTLLGLFVILFYISSIFSLNIKKLDDPLQIKSTKELYFNPNLFDLSLKNLGSTRFLIRDIINLFNDDGTVVDINHEDEDIDEDIEDEPVVIVPDYERHIDDTKWNEMIDKEKNSVIKNLHEFYQSRTITNKNEYTGLFKDKNLILIMVEAFDMSVIDKEITPTLYKLSKEGWYFDNYYAPKFSCTTGESEFIALTSIIPSNSVCTPHTYVNNDYKTSIFNLFNKSGYTSTSYHSWTDQYYPRTKLHKNMGSTFYNANKLNINTSGAWPSDNEFIEKAYNVFSKNDKYFSFLITVTMHFSYDFDDVNVRRNWSKVKNVDASIPMRRYLAKAIELDKGLENLLNNLEEDGTLDDTVIVLFGDHHPYNLSFSELAKRSSVDRYKDLNEDLMPFIIYNNEMKPMTISKTASTFDILPTLANLFDLEYDPRYYTGTDVFSDEETIAIFPNGSWVTDKAVYFSSTGKYKSKEEITDKYIKTINKQVSNWFTISQNTLNKDYFKHRFK